MHSEHEEPNSLRASLTMLGILTMNVSFVLLSLAEFIRIKALGNCRFLLLEWVRKCTRYGFVPL